MEEEDILVLVFTIVSHTVPFKFHAKKYLAMLGFAWSNMGSQYVMKTINKMTPKRIFRKDGEEKREMLI